MSRRPAQGYICGDLEALARQLLFVPPARRMEQVRRAEKLHDEIDPDQTYPLDYLKFRITGHRVMPDDDDDTAMLVGQAVLPDLRLLIDSLSRSAPLTLQPGEEAETPAALAARLNVSTRTLARWRELGLRWRWIVPGESGGIQSSGRGRRPGVVIMRSASDRFIANHAGRASAAAAFSQLTDAQRRRLIHRARRIAMARDVTLNQVASHLARRAGRALETVRQILLQHDQKHPDKPIFADRTGPLTQRQQAIIVRARRRGVSVRRLAQRFDRTYSTIYRVLNQQRAIDLGKLDFSCITLPTFEREDADAVILRPVRLSTGWRAVTLRGLPEELLAIYAQPGLSDAPLHRLLIQYNYLKFKADRLRQTLDRHEPRVTDMNQIEALARDINRRRDELVRACLHEVMATAQRHLTSEATPAGPGALADLLLLGNAVLFESIEQFDPARSRSMAGFLTYRLQRRFAPAASESQRAHRRMEPAALAAQLHAHAKAYGIRLTRDHPEGPAPTVTPSAES